MEHNCCYRCKFLEADGFCILHGDEAENIVQCEDKELSDHVPRFIDNEKELIPTTHL